METQLSEDIEVLNSLSLVSYLNILGFTPIAEGPNSTNYQVHIDEFLTLTIDHATNRFHDKANNRQGSLVDFACILFEITPVELINNISPYRIDELMKESIRQAAGCL